MSAELDDQNDLIDSLDRKADSNTARVKDANSRAAILLRSK